MKIKTPVVSTHSVQYAPPFAVPWQWSRIPPDYENSEQDYYSLGAYHDDPPGDHIGQGYVNGRNQGYFSVGLGDVPVPAGAPIGWWGWQRKFILREDSRHFWADFDDINVTFVPTGGRVPGGTPYIWASILQLRVSDQMVLHGTVVPVVPGYAGSVKVVLAAMTADQLEIPNVGEEYWIRVGWVVQIHYVGEQNPHLVVNSRISNFGRNEPIHTGTPVGVVKSASPRSKETVPTETGKLPVAIQKGKLLASCVL